jgi:hypothetical protein
MISEIITGEKIQQSCDMYIGNVHNFRANPLISNQPHKHVNIDLINKEFQNPYIVFCYSHVVNKLSTIINYFKNKFVLITHNSDHNIELNEFTMKILNNPNLVKWYAQNTIYQHNKLHLLPIGLANSMWAHGNLSPFNDITLTNNLHNKSKHIYFQFNINTNIEKRKICYESLQDKIEWLDNINPVQNLYRLKEYRFCICPEGNGVDTHRLWECLYLRVVPIVINTPFTQILLKYNIPLVVLNKWDDISNAVLNYENHRFDDELFSNLLHFNKLINKIMS